MSDIENKAELDELINNWTDSGQEIKRSFLRLMDYLKGKENNVLSFNARPGITYSLRAKHNNQKKHKLYVMVDIIDDDPADRWLSVCFYGEMISDPEENGDYVPEGLLGEDALCFDIEQWDEKIIAYVEQRLDEAHADAAKET